MSLPLSDESPLTVLGGPSVQGCNGDAMMPEFDHTLSEIIQQQIHTHTHTHTHTHNVHVYVYAYTVDLATVWECLGMWLCVCTCARVSVCMCISELHMLSSN